MSITYTRSRTNILVGLDDRLVGRIKQVEGGYAYFPHRSRTKGTTYPTIEQVKRTLEQD